MGRKLCHHKAILIFPERITITKFIIEMVKYQGLIKYKTSFRGFEIISR